MEILSTLVNTTVGVATGAVGAVLNVAGSAVHGVITVVTTIVK